MDYSVAFWIGPIAVPWYGIMVWTGIVLALFFSYLRWIKNGYLKKDFFLMSGFGIIIAFFGARWWYLAFNPSSFNQPMDLLMIFNSGRAVQGAMVSGGIWIYFYIKKFMPDAEFAKIGSMIIPHALLAQAIGRWGNFFNQEIYGAIITPEQAEMLPDFIAEIMYIDGYYRNPLFLWESIANMCGWVLIAFVAYHIKWFKPGTHIAMYTIWYNTTRLIIEPMRDPEFIMNIAGVPTTFILSIIFLVFGIWGFIYYQWFYGKVDFKKKIIAITRGINLTLLNCYSFRLNKASRKNLTNSKREKL